MFDRTSIEKGHGPCPSRPHSPPWFYEYGRLYPQSSSVEVHILDTNEFCDKIVASPLRAGMQLITPKHPFWSDFWAPDATFANKWQLFGRHRPESARLEPNFFKCLPILAEFGARASKNAFAIMFRAFVELLSTFCPALRPAGADSLRATLTHKAPCCRLLGRGNRVQRRRFSCRTRKARHRPRTRISRRFAGTRCTDRGDNAPVRRKAALCTLVLAPSKERFHDAHRPQTASGSLANAGPSEVVFQPTRTLGVT